MGTITNLIGGEGENVLDEVGKGSIKIHGADTPSVALCQDYRIVRVLADSSVSGSSHELACFFVTGGGKPEIVGRHVIYTFSGPDLTGLLKYGNIRFNVISDGAGDASSTPIQDLLDSYVQKAWLVENHGTAPNGGLAVGSGESSFVVLINLLFQLNAHFSFSLYDNPYFTLHMWYEHTATSGTGFNALTLQETTDPASYQANAGVAIITQPIRVVKEPQEVYTRAWVYGAGMGSDRWTFKEFNLGPLVIPGWGMNNNQSLIINQTLEAQIPEIGVVKQFPELEPEDPNDDFSIEVNAKAIFYSGFTWLKHRAKSEIVYYEIVDVVIHADLIPGQLVHVTYNRSSPVNSSGGMVTTEIIDLDDDLIVLSIHHKLGKDGVRYTSLVVGDTPKRPSTGLNMMAEKLKELEGTIKHTNAGSGTAGEPGGDGTYLWASGSGPTLTGDLLVDSLVTIDGVDISAHVAEPDAHHEPGTLNATTFNAHAGGSEYHAIEASSNPGPQVYLLKTDAGGRLVLTRADLGSLVLTDRTTAQKYNIFLNNGKMFIEPIS